MEAVSKLKNKYKVNKILIEKYKDINENPDFEQNYYSKTSTAIHNYGHAGIKILKCLACYDRS